MSNKLRKSGGLRRKMLCMTTIPIFFTGIVIMFFCYYNFLKTMDGEVKNGLQNIALGAIYAYSDFYDENIIVGANENNTYSVSICGKRMDDYLWYIDNLKADAGVDITLFYYDVRVLTTIKDADGNRIVGTVANKNVSEYVLKEEKARFYNNMKINDAMYYAYYTPVLNKHGECIGMVFAGKPTESIRRETMETVLPIFGISAIMMLLGALISVSTARGIAGVIEKEERFLGEIAKGNLRANIDANILARKDELGDMGRFTVHVQKFIRDMIERDGLTRLYTRRIGEVKIQYAQTQAIESGCPYCIVMADIDHFKRFNDTYGHDCGDLVLRETAAVFNRTLGTNGFAVRWGGEEIIVFYENMNIDRAYEELSILRDAVRNNRLNYNGEELSITMTFGLIEGDERSINDIVKDADELLYEGKTGGRDRIVVKR